MADASFIPDSAVTSLAPVQPPANGPIGSFIPDSAVKQIGDFIPDSAAAAPGSVLTQEQWLGCVPTAQITKVVPEDLRTSYLDGTATPEQQAQIKPYLDAYKAKAGKLELVQSNDLPASQKPAAELPAPIDSGSPALDTALRVLTAPVPNSVLNFGQKVIEGTLEQGNQALRGLGYDAATRKLIGATPDNPYAVGQENHPDIVASQKNVLAGMELGTFQAANMLRTATNRIANRVLEGSGIAQTAFEEQFRHDLMADAVTQGLSTGGGLPGKTPVSPDTVASVSQSLFSQPNLLIPGMEGAGFAEDASGLAARTLEAGGTDTLPTTARKLAGQAIGAPITTAAKLARPIATKIDQNPLMSAGLAAGGTALMGGDAKDIVLAAIAGSAEGKVGLLTKAVDTAANQGAKLAGKAPNGPLARFALSAFDTVAPHAQAAVAAQLANTPFLLGADDENQFKTLLAGGLLAHAAGEAGGSVANSLNIARNLWAEHPTLPEARLPVKPYNTDATLDAAHQKVMDQIGNSGNNFVQSIRDYFGKNRGELYTLTPADYSAALDKAAAAGHISPDTAAQAKAQQGITYSVPATPDNEARSVALSKVTQNTPGISVGHEAGHLLQSLLSPDELGHAYQQILDTYGPEQFNLYRQKYGDLANRTLSPGDAPVSALTDRQVASEIFAEHASAVLNSVPIAQFSDPAMKQGPQLARTVYSLVGRGLEKLGIKTPQLVDGASNVKTGTGIEPSAKLGNIVHNVLQAHALDEPVLTGTQWPGEKPPVTPVSPAPANATEIPNSEPAVVKPKQTGFKKGDPIGEINSPGGTLLAEDAIVTKPLGNVDGTPYYQIEYTHPDTGAKMTGNVPETWLQSAVPKQPEAPEGTTATDTVTPKHVENVVRPQAEAGHIRSSAEKQDQVFGKQGTTDDIAANKAAFQKIISAPTKPGQAVEIVHSGASGAPDLNQMSRERDRLLSEAAARTGDLSLKQPNQKVIVPFKDSGAKAPNEGVFALDTSKIIQNAAIVDQWLKENGQHEPLFADMNELRGKLQKYLENQTNGYGGGGSRLVRPKDTRAGSVPDENPNFTPHKLDDADVQKLNLLMGYAPARSRVTDIVRANSDYFRRFAEESGRQTSKTPLALTETNPYRAKIQKAGFNTDLLNQATSQIRYRDIVGRAKPRPDLNVSAGSTAIAKAGFMPDVASQEAENEHAKYIGTQEGFGPVPSARLYNLKQGIPGHPLGSTVTEQTLREAGVPVPKGTESTNALNTRIDKPPGSAGTLGTPSYMPNPSKDVFYDTIDRALDTWQPKGTPEQLLAHLAKTKGTKEQAAWIGLDDFLKDKKNVTKEDVRHFVAQNAVNVQEKTLSADKSAEDRLASAEMSKRTTERELSEQAWQHGFSQEDAQRLPSHLESGRIHIGKLPDELDQYARAHLDAVREYNEANDPEDGFGGQRGAGETKYSEYQLPGGENYRELLVTLPDKSLVRSDEIYEQRKSLKDAGVPHTDPRAVALDIERDAIENAPLKNQFKSGHFDEPNILAHVRYNERELPDGKKMLFLEELQSDWHQKGRQQGYQANNFDALEKNYRTLDKAYQERLSAFDDIAKIARAKMTDPSLQELSSKVDKAHAAWIDALGRRSSGVPDAPFKTTWPALAMKRMIRLAAEKGFDKIGWTTGEQQAERYDLSKQVDSVRVRRKENGTYSIYATPRNETSLVPISHDAKPEALAGLVGKELAEKISRQREGIVEYHGGDLKIGGEGMKGFYDKILPSVANELGKKFGKKFGAKVMQEEIPSAMQGRQQSDGVGGLVRTSKPTGLTVHSLEITPEMKESVLQGMPLFHPSLDATSPFPVKAPRPVALPLASAPGPKRKKLPLEK